MKEFEKIYTELKNQYTDQEIADSILIPQNLSSLEAEKANEELKAFRLKLLREQTEEQRIYSDILRFKFLLEDYIENEEYTESKNFGKQIEEYLRILKRKKKELSEEIAIHYTRLSRIINGKEEPNVELTYRLEKHSGELIPALLWWKLIIKKQEFNIKRDFQTRKRESAKVKNPIKFRA
jgi:plasmid maintenance system antidote protein VapI